MQFNFNFYKVRFIFTQTIIFFIARAQVFITDTLSRATGMFPKEFFALEVTKKFLKN
jgi:hypothetical protein